MKPCLLVLSILMVLYPGFAQAGAWVQEPGTTYVRFVTGYLGTDERYDASGDRVPFDDAGGGTRDTQFKDLSSTLYMEWGVHPRWNLIADLTWKYVEAVQPSAAFKTWGLGDIRLAIKRGLLQDSRFVLATGAMVLFPTGYDSDEYPSLGSGVNELALFLQGGTSGTGYWVNGDVFFRYRGDPFRPLLEAAVSGGSGKGRFNVRGEVRAGVPIGDSTLNGSPDDLRFDPTTVDPTWLDLAGVASFDTRAGVGVELELRSTVAGENTLSGTRISIAIATSPVWRWSGS